MTAQSPPPPSESGGELRVTAVLKEKLQVFRVEPELLQREASSVGNCLLSGCFRPTVLPAGVLKREIAAIVERKDSFVKRSIDLVARDVLEHWMESRQRRYAAAQIVNPDHSRHRQSAVQVRKLLRTSFQVLGDNLRFDHGAIDFKNNQTTPLPKKPLQED